LGWAAPYPADDMSTPKLSRRGFCQTLGAGVTAAALAPKTGRAADAYQFRFIVGSSMYGGLGLDEILPQVRKTGAAYVDIWASHAKPVTQRQMIDEMGHGQFLRMLKEHHVQVGCFTHFKLGPFGLQEEMHIAKKLGVDAAVLVCGGKGPKGLKGSELKSAVRRFAEHLKPHVAAAEGTGTVIAIENHGNNLIESPDSMKWLVEFAASKHLGIALAPYHLEQDAKMIARLVEDLGNRIALFYAWQHGMGCMRKLPKEQELLQLPGRGPLDFTPIVAAMKRIRFRGFTEIFMHPVPRGIPIMETPAQVTAEINRARSYLETCRTADER